METKEEWVSFYDDEDDSNVIAAAAEEENLEEGTTKIEQHKEATKDELKKFSEEFQEKTKKLNALLDKASVFANFLQENLAKTTSSPSKRKVDEVTKILLNLLYFRRNRVLNNLK
jgi:hypothetical protein